MAMAIGPAYTNAAAQQNDAEALVWKMDPRVSVFHDALQPYGEWFKSPQYGWSWTPYQVSIDWRPYTQGHWVYTDYGWTWTSYWPWGWACFHYGRWYLDESRGWCWCPDTVWAPAWCDWRLGDDWIAWAALPPQAVWREGLGLSFGEFDTDNYISHKAYCFVRKNEFLAEDTFGHVRAAAENESLFYQTSFIGNNMQISGSRIVNEIPSRAEIEALVGHPVDTFKVKKANSGANTGIRDKELWVYRLQ